MTSPERAAIGLGEFVALMATLTALVAVSIDMVLPALPAIGATLGVERANDNQLVVSLLFLGFGLGQLFYGPLSDATGRKPAAYVGLALFTVGCMLALLSENVPADARGAISAGHRRCRAAYDHARAGERQVRRPCDGTRHVAHHGRVYPGPYRGAGDWAGDSRRLWMAGDLWCLPGDGADRVWLVCDTSGGDVAARPPDAVLAWKDGGRHTRGRDQSKVHWLHDRFGLCVWCLSRIPDLRAADPPTAVRARNAVSLVLCDARGRDWRRLVRQCQSRCPLRHARALELVAARHLHRVGRVHRHSRASVRDIHHSGCS